MVDANMKWSVNKALEASRAFAEYNVYWLEEPTIPDDIEGNRRIETEGPTPVASGENLLHYLALRDRDLRDLQLQLYRLGLSSLGRAERHVLPSAAPSGDAAVREWLQQFTSLEESQRALAALFGQREMAA